MVLSIIIIWIRTEITMLLSQLHLLAYHPHPDLQTCRVTLRYVNQVTPSVKPAAATNKTGTESADNSSVCRTSKPHMTRQPVVHMWGFSDCQVYLVKHFQFISPQHYRTYVTLDHKTSLKSLGYICSNSQKYIVWVKMINFSFMPKIIRTLSKDHVP